MKKDLLYGPAPEMFNKKNMTESKIAKIKEKKEF